MKILLKSSTMLLLCIAFSFVAKPQIKRTRPNRTSSFVETVIPLKNANAYYCRESDDFTKWTREFKGQIEFRLIPLLSKGGGFEFITPNHSVRLKIPRKNVEAARQFFVEQEKSKPDASEEERKKGVTKICPQGRT